MICAYRGHAPKIPDSVFLAPGTFVIGDVTIGENSSIWFNTVIRGDVNRVVIGANTNVQDGCVLHVTFQKWNLSIGDNVTIGHGAIVHGCTIKDSCLIGMGSRILDGAEIGSFSLIAAGSLVREKMVIPERTLAAGVPAVVKRDLSDSEIQLIGESAKRYVGYKNSYMDGDFQSVN